MQRRSHSCYLQIGNPHCRDNSEHHEEHASDHGAGYAGKHRPDFPEDAAQEHGAGTGNDHRSTPYLGQEEEEAVAHEPARRGEGRRAPAPACRAGAAPLAEALDGTFGHRLRGSRRRAGMLALRGKHQYLHTSKYSSRKALREQSWSHTYLLGVILSPTAVRTLTVCC